LHFSFRCFRVPAYTSIKAQAGTENYHCGGKSFQTSRERSFDTGRYEKLAEYYDLPMWLPDSRRFVFSHEGKAFIADIETKKVREMFSIEGANDR